jgi:hypothetical protein
MKAITNSFMGLNEIYFHAAAVKVGQTIRFLFEKRSPTVNRQWGSLSTQNKNGQEKAAYILDAGIFRKV